MRDAALLRLTPVHNRTDTPGPCCHRSIQGAFLIEVAWAELLVVEIKHLHTLFKDVAAFSETVTVPEQLPNVLDRAVRTALARRAPAVLVVPADVQALDHHPPEQAFKTVPSSLDLSGCTHLTGAG